MRKINEIKSRFIEKIKKITDLQFDRSRGKCSNYQNQKSGNINVDLTEIKGLYYKQLYVKKLDNLDET